MCLKLFLYFSKRLNVCHLGLRFCDSHVKYRYAVCMRLNRGVLKTLNPPNQRSKKTNAVLGRVAFFAPDRALASLNIFLARNKSFEFSFL